MSKSLVLRARTLALHLAKDVVGRALVLTGLHRRLLRGKSIVVAFHSVTPGLTDGALRCSTRHFQGYCAFFAQHLTPVPLTRLIDQLKSGEDLGGELAITFDDGYADNAELAQPILARWKLPATFYVSTGFIDSETQAPWDAEASVRSRWMTWPQVASLAASGYDIGTHTVTHANLAKLQAADVTSELCQSRDTVRERTGKVPTHFAVPFGRDFATMGEVGSIASSLGYQSVTLCRGGIVHPATQPMRVERWPIDPLHYLSPYGWLFDVIRERPGSVSGASVTATAMS